MTRIIFLEDESAIREVITVYSVFLLILGHSISASLIVIYLSVLLS